MRSKKCLAQVRACHVRIDRCGGDPLMSQELLDRAQIAAAFNEMGGEGMPQRVGSHPIGQIEWFGMTTHDQEDPTTG